MEQLAEHVGVWKSYRYLKENGRVIAEHGLTGAVRQDLQEGRPVIVDDTIWVIFLHDRTRKRYFLEKAFTSTDKTEVFDAFILLQKECF